MIRSEFAINRLIVLPYAVLLILYFTVVGGGAAWLWHQVRAAETQLLIDDMMAALEPLVQRLRSADAFVTMRNKEGWLVTDIERLFTDMSALREVSIRGVLSGYQMERNRSGAVSSRAVSPLPKDARSVTEYPSASVQLTDNASELFVIRFDIAEAASSPVRLDFAFNRSMLMDRIEEGMGTIKQSILLFGSAGTLSILIAVVITGLAMRVTRRLESHFQDIYQRASLTETVAQLVHELRNPLAALRANVKALQVAPQETPQIIQELDQDIVTLNDKLSAFLDLTRKLDEAAGPVDVAELIDEAVRLAEPALVKQGLTVRTEVPTNLQRPHWQKIPLRGALLNLILNASQSGQQDGTIRISVQAKEEYLEIAVEDRGRGISRQQMPRLFDAFYTTREDGNGLGLAIVQRIVTQHQGFIHAEDRPDGGARFVITLPLQRKETPHWWDRMNRHSPA